jgi:hypothetical protein
MGSNWFRPSLPVALALLTIGSILFSGRAVRGNAPFLVTGEAQKSAVAGQPNAPNAPPVMIEGFRQARFGMSEEQVRQIVHKDFPAAKIISAINPAEKTTVLAVTGTDLLPDTGNAHISYIFGYRSKKLIQVNIVWTSDRTSSGDAAVVAAANSLRDYFAAENFPPNSVVVNYRLAGNAILVFRGTDEQKRTVLLVLSGAAVAARPEDRKAPRPAPLTLELSYVEDAAHPDVFRIAKGLF